jgi:gliding motility-associated lipoprotein GldH
MRMKKRIVFAFGTVFALLILACNQTPCFFSDNVSIANETWCVNNQIPFNFTITDTQAIYTIGLIIRYSHEYPNQNIYVFLHSLFPNGMRMHDTISINLFSPQGKPLGKGKRVIELEKDVARVSFPLKGSYRMALEQAMRKDSLPGIVSIGLYILNPTNISTNGK